MTHPEPLSKQSLHRETENTMIIVRFLIKTAEDVNFVFVRRIALFFKIS